MPPSPAPDTSGADAEFLRGVLAASVDCIKVLDLDGRLLFINEGGRRVLEVDDFEAVRGLPLPELWQGADRATAWRAVHAARAGGIGEFRAPANSFAGTPKYWDVLITAMRDPDGQPERLLAITRDITATRQAEQNLARSEERLSLALNASGMIGIWDWEMVAGTVFADASCARLFGFEPTAAGIPQADFIRNIHPADLPAFGAELRRALAGEAVFSHEYRVMRADGSSRWVLARGRAVRDEAGRAVRFPGTVVDINSRKSSELRRVALVELGDRLRDLTEPADMAYAGAAALAQALDLGRAGFGLIDVARETILIERDWSAPGLASLAGTHRFRDYGSYIEDLQAGRTVVVDDVTADPRTAPMAEAWAALRVGSMINLPIFELGHFVALALVQRTYRFRWPAEEIDFIRNVAERIRLAITRRRAEQRLQNLAASLERQVAERTRERDRAWRVSRDLLGVADKQGVWRSINPAWTEILGWLPEDVIGRTSAWFKHPDNDHIHPADIADRTDSLHYEGRYRARDGSYRWIAWTVVPSEDELYCVGRDVTAEKEQAAAFAETEEQLRQAQKMEAVGQLTGGIAHDFNNLLAGIVGSLELMQARISQGRVAEAARFVTAAQGAAQRAAALTHRLLAFSRRQTLDPRPTQLNKLIAGMEDLIRRTVGPAITVEVVGAGGLWSTLCDPNQLENALLNLCINARDAMPDGGRLTIETANASLDPRAARSRELIAGQYAALCVSDTGTGMTQEVVERVFEPFFTTKPIGQGTGLGLSMVYGFARQSGGQVRIYSEPGQGTTVKLYLPRHLGEAGEADATQPAEAQPPQVRPEQTVLVVDDEPTVLMLVTEVLHDLGYATLEAGDGPAALRILQSGTRLDLLVTDVGLPGGMNGRQLAEAARVGRPELKVLFITGYAENAALGSGYVGPGMQVMTKPFAIEALVTKVRGLTA